MKTPVKKIKNKHRGIAMILAMVFVVIFSAISIGFLSLSSANTQVSSNHRDSNNALAAAQSGLDCAMYILRTTPTFSTGINNVTEDNAVTMWTNLYNRLVAANLGNTTETKTGSAIGDTITTGTIPYGNGGSFQIRFTRTQRTVNGITINEITAESTGMAGSGAGISRKAGMKADIIKDATVLQYAIAGRGRMWLTGDTTIHGSIYSSWNRANISPFNMTSDSSVEGTINTVLTKDQVNAQSYQLETLGANGNPMYEFGADAYDCEGNPVCGTSGPVDEEGYLLDNDSLLPVYDENGYRIAAQYENRIYSDANGNGRKDSGSEDDEILGHHEGINYGQPDHSNIPGLNIADYDTTGYRIMANYAYTATTNGSTISNGKLPTSGYSTVTEYFPHAANNYNAPKSGTGCRTLNRRKYENKTMRNVVVSNNNNALFKNCTFEEVLYIDCGTSSGTSSFNNVRFENCTFNGVIVTNTPQTLTSSWWQKNCLYFTGEATFQNNSSIPEATILAPHFNVNLGNTNPNAGENNVLTGAIVGGIVDVRGNAEIYGTIISMADTSAYSSGYVTNIGATEFDGGNETTEAGDIGTIEITPSPDQMLPSGITTPVIFDFNSATYTEPHC